MIRDASAGRFSRRPPSTPRRADGPLAFAVYRRRVSLHGSASASTVAAIAAAIQTHEGYYPGSVAYSNNNPGNLVYVGQAGASPGAGGFARFPSYQAGYQALTDQISLDISRGSDATGKPISTLSDLISSWAPPSDPRNDTGAYIAAVSAQTGIDPNAPLSSASGVPVFSVTVTGDGGDSSTNSAGSAGFGVDLASLIPQGSVDLSNLGIQNPVPYWALGLAALGLIALSR